MKKTFSSALIGLLIGLCSVPQFVYSAASGNYTDLLPIGAPSDTTVISNGSGYSITTLPPTQTFGDSLSRLVDVVYQSTGTPTVTNTTSETNIISSVTASAKVGSSTFPIQWAAVGRSIEVVADGYFSTTNSGGTNWTWGIKLGTTSILSSGAVSLTPGQTRSPFHVNALMTMSTVGAGGAVNGYMSVFQSSATASFPTTIMQSTFTTLAVSCDLSNTSTGQNSVNPVITLSNTASSITFNNVQIKFHN